MYHADQTVECVDVENSLIENQKKENKQQKEKECTLNQVSPLTIIHSFNVKSVDQVHHISCVTTDLVWASDHRNNLILTNTSGDILHHLTELCSGYGGSHVVTSIGEVIYIDKSFNIIKLSSDMKKTTELISNTDYTWIKRSVFCSPVNGDLLVGMSCGDTPFWMDILYTDKSKVNRYDQNGQLKLSIEFDNTGLELYKVPHKITENNNKDVVVSDLSGAVVVTDSRGKHRFSYTGHPPGSGILPRGVCTDALSRILICDIRSKSIQLIDNNGQFLQILFTTTQDEDIPWCLSYDTNNQRL